MRYGEEFGPGSRRQLRPPHHVAAEGAAEYRHLSTQLIAGAMAGIREGAVMASEPQMLFGLSPDPDSPTPTLIPREVAEQILRSSPAMAKALGITEEALRTGTLGPASATVMDFPELKTMDTRVLPEDVPPRVLQTLRQQQVLRRTASRPTMGPRDALALHAELRASLARDGMHKWVGVWLTEYDSKRIDHIDEIPDRVTAVGTVYCGELREALREAETYLVAAEANPLITAAAEGLPWTMAAQPNTPPSSDGFMVFASPYEISDSVGNTMRVRAVSWITSPGANDVRMHQLYEHARTQAESWPEGVGDGILLAFWGEQDDHPALTRAEARKIKDVKQRLGTGLFLTQTLMIPVGVPLQDWPLFTELLERGNAEAVVGPIAMAMATWMLMKQPIVTTGRAALPPRIRKEIRKQGRIRGDISVINLRQRPPSAERLPAEGESVQREYHFRWTVKGHWRHQPVGPGRRDREWIYIWAHVKGPADKPLIQRRRVYRVSGRL